MNPVLRVALAVAVWFEQAIAKATGPATPAGILMAATEKRWLAFVKWTMQTFGRPMGIAAFVSLSPIMGIVGTVLVVIIVVLVLAALAPTFFQAVADITGALLSADLNSTLANTIAAIVAILVPLALLFGFVVLIFRATRMSGR